MHRPCAFFQSSYIHGMERQDMIEWRHRLGYSQIAAGQVLGLHRRTIQEYEAGNLTIPKVVSLACKQLESENTCQDG